MTEAAAQSRILTLVFTDLADSTALKTQHGDQRVGELIARHRALVSTLASASAGRVIDWAGDGRFLTFETPSAAVTFALRLQQAHSEERDLPGVEQRHLVAQPRHVAPHVPLVGEARGDAQRHLLATSTN